MKTLSVIFLVLIFSVLIYFFILGQQSQSGKAMGLINNQLTPCPGTPNCVNSEYPEDQAHYISPIRITPGDKIHASPLPRLKNIIQGMGGSVVTIENNYLAATFSSSLFRFVDDVEVRIDTKENIIHLRSASRVGHGDMGVNKKRITQIKQLYKD